MKRIDHVRKTVYLIVGCLTIFSLVLTICHKVGHCAETPYQFPISTYYDEFPSDYTGDLTLDDYLNFIRNTLHISDNSNYISYYTFDNGVPYFRVVKFSSSALNLYSNSNLGSNDRINITEANTRLSSNQSVYVSAYSVTFYYIKIQNGNFTKTGESSYASWTFANSQYLFYSSADLTNGNDTCFYKTVERPDPGPNPHSKGAVLGNYVDSTDLIEQDSSLPTVDTSAPADPSSNSGWFQKILNGMGKINQSIKAGVLTIGDYLGQIKEDLENAIAWLIEPFDQEQFSSDLNQIALINDLSNLKTLVENCGMFDWSDVTPAQSVSFTFDFGGAVLPHTSCVIDFSWYTGTVKNLCVGVLCTFLVIGLLVTIINQLPNIIGGKSGDKGGGSDS